MRFRIPATLIGILTCVLSACGAPPAAQDAADPSPSSSRAPNEREAAPIPTAVAAPETWAKIKIGDAIRVAKEDGSTVSPDQLSALNGILRTRGQGFVVNSGTEVLRAGRILTDRELIELGSPDSAAEILNSNHCEIREERKLYRKKNLFSRELQLKGDLIASTRGLVVSPISGSVDAYGNGAVTQTVRRDYAVMNGAHSQELLASVSCYRVLKSDGTLEAQRNLDSFLKAQAFTALVNELSRGTSLEDLN